MKGKLLKLGMLRLDGGTQPRTDVDHDVVDNYAQAYRAGAKFPPAVVFFDGKEYWLADGFHRWWASRQAERKTLLCDIRKGTQEDAQWYSYSANRTHGLHRSNADKQKAVKAALLHPNGAKLSDGQIAEWVGVSVAMVGKHRKQLEPTIKDLELPARTGRDGRTRNTANIGKPKPTTISPETQDDSEEDQADDEPEEVAQEAPALRNDFCADMNAAWNSVLAKHAPHEIVIRGWLESRLRELTQT